MKKLYTHILIILFISLLFSACRELQLEPENYFMYNDAKYELENGYYYTYEVHQGVSIHLLYLVSDGISFNTTETSFEGEGDYITAFFSTGSDEIFSGTFPLTTTNNAFCLDCIMGNANVISIQTGSITISIEENIFEIEFTLVIDDQNSVTGRYKGSLTEIISFG